jgi:thiosulfate/3-mercaptopyruvate sulfurtransferase
VYNEIKNGCEFMSIIVSNEWLAGRIAENENGADSTKVKNLILIDCRYILGQPAAGREAYDQGHIPGAFYMDLEKDLSGTKNKHGGRHPLPDLGVFILRLGEIGVDETITVVAYDDQGGAMASRFWWMLHFLGHTNAYILDGGFAQWQAAGYPTSVAKPSIVQSRTFKPHVLSHLLVSMNEVKDKMGSKDTLLIDSREERRYLGLEEPIDPAAGHIPGAINAFWKDSLNGAGQWKNSQEQQQRFAGIPLEQELIVYCGSGVTACPNVVALKEAGYTNVKLYVGSWSDWISYAGNPIATGEE